MTIGLGILLLNLHNPVYTAETVATLDIIARGNFIFGVGLGYRDVEFDAFGVPKGERVKRFEEYLALVQRLWTEESVSYEGAHPPPQRAHEHSPRAEAATADLDRGQQ